MSIYQENVRAFIEVINSNSDLISAGDREQLEKLIDNLPEDDADICEQIEEWLEDESRAKISAAYEEKLDEISCSSSTKSEQLLGLGGSKPPSIPNADNTSLKQQIQSCIIINPPPPTEKEKEEK